ncbi:energy-coupling factor transporter ATP-binding protein EcfA2 [Silvimonas terrae]|uniref:Energy-coupling factor transporter ATP-binding protein EcfA2 n=1 Tax=Silvimonas terrae TaxID=300266 RepID=A0A840RJ69_9NEIS|nr:TniB family NTP-binding protein [Silvimonas terrae]MBB5192292.1 energy-coupling factor transporter ATP-binding protein EcfA2 [Silvimonas terrae]
MMTQFSPDSGPASLAALGYKLIVEPIPHRRYREAMFHLAELHQRQRTHGRGGGVLLTGPSGSGKSTILRNYHAAFPRVHEAHRTCVPVLYVPVPSSPTVRSLAAAILEALGDRNSHRGTAPEKTTRIRELFQRCGVEMLLLDEFQHIFYAQSISAFRDATDWIKNLLEDTGIGMVACGLSTAEYVVTSNEQLARRFSQRIRILPFSMEDEQDFLEYRGVLKLLEARLPFGTSLPLYEANVARRVYIGSYGLLDYTIKILEGAVSAANRVGQEEIDLPILCAGFRDRVWRDVPDRLNPFYPDSPLRPLDRPGEIFHQHTRQDAIGSPVANRLGLRLAKGGA